MQCALAALICCSIWLAWSAAQLPYQHHPALPFKFSEELIFSTTNVLPEDREMSADVETGNASSYIYLHGAQGPLTLIIRPCSSSINVTIYHVPQNNTGYLRDYIQGRSKSLKSSEGMREHVFSWGSAPAGLYLLDLVAAHRVTKVTLYAAVLPGVPAALRVPQRPRLRVQPRARHSRITLRWDQSVVDPQKMHYCVVVNSKRNFTSLCEAKFAPEMNVHPVTNIDPTKYENSIHKQMSKKHAMMGHLLGKDDIFITCVGAGLSYTISNLQKGRNYYFNVFAKYRETQLSFLYGSKSIVYDSRVRPIGLRDNKPITVNIRKLGGKALFRYKVSKEYRKGNTSAAELSWHVMPCGGAVEAEVRQRRQVVVARQVVQGYGHLRVPDPRPRDRYSLLLRVPDYRQLRNILGVEVLATMRQSPLPQLPVEATVHELASLRRCDSVTVAWLPTPSPFVRYCVSASPVPPAETEAHFRPLPNQCNLDYLLRSQLDFATQYCQDFSANDHRNALKQTITKLRPGKEYLIQVTVKKIKGKALSYDLLRIRTNLEC